MTEEPAFEPLDNMMPPRQVAFYYQGIPVYANPNFQD